ncbi:MAG TPA: acetyl-CoA carboxylase carboxyl transferase subunit alpha [Campylobacterales bacterium]|nr:acetyl-CoA carboxylase carboxyl transferase subunit alpha [Campylobacterales bacterium]HIO70699.1 acetyl-CoA carboxylase carboxyl transferase subunit alpha [Campylobacterales bacterium]
MATYLDFEQKFKSIQDSIDSAKLRNDIPAVEILNEELDREVEKVFSNLTPYQKLQLARHPDRPYALDYVRLIMRDYYELHGDRHFADDKSIVAFIGYIGDQRFVVIGEQKGRGTKKKIYRNFGMPHPEGYRKALRVAKLAEKFGIPILFLIDTPGAYPGIGAEERNQSEAIARNLYELSKISVPTIAVVIGEGGSGGALAIGVADKLAMMRYSVFSVISPEGCAAILWKDPKMVETATKALKITAEDLKELGLIDDIIEEPKIGAHREKEKTAKLLKNYVLEKYSELSKLSKEELLNQRYQKIVSYGAFEETTANMLDEFEKRIEDKNETE